MHKTFWLAENVRDLRKSCKSGHTVVRRYICVQRYGFQRRIYSYTSAIEFRVVHGQFSCTYISLRVYFFYILLLRQQESKSKQTSFEVRDRSENCPIKDTFLAFFSGFVYLPPPEDPIQRGYQGSFFFLANFSNSLFLQIRLAF